VDALVGRAWLGRGGSFPPDRILAASLVEIYLFFLPPVVFFYLMRNPFFNSLPPRTPPPLVQSGSHMVRAGPHISKVSPRALRSSPCYLPLRLFPLKAIVPCLWQDEFGKIPYQCQLAKRVTPPGSSRRLFLSPRSTTYGRSTPLATTNQQSAPGFSLFASFGFFSPLGRVQLGL